MSWNIQQQNRYQKIFTEPLYLIDLKKEEDKSVFLISGSTKNVYEIIYKNKKFQCNCPDAKSWSKKHHVVCKHICFVLFRVSKMFVKLGDKIYFGFDMEKSTLFFDIHKLNDIEQEFMDNFISKRQIGNDVMNEGLKEKYLETVNVPPTQIFQKSTKILETSDECPICYDVLLNEEYTIEILLSCPDCKNYVHPKCMSKWLEYNKSCVYCRSDIWMKLNEKKNKDYINLN